MDLNNVVLEIISEAEKKAKEIAESADKERERMLGEARERARKKGNELEKETYDKIRQMRVKELAVSRMNAKKIEMNARKEAVENAYEKFSGSIYEEMDRKELLKKLLETGKGQIDAATVYVNEHDFEHAKKLFKNVEKADVNGMIIENADKTERLDITLETLMENLRKETLNEVSKILFGEK